MFLAATSLLAAVGAVFVERYLHFGFDERRALTESEAKVLDVDTASSPHAFVVGLDGSGLLA